MRVLVVDDSAYARRRIRQVLEQAGYEVVEAPDGETALRLVQEKPVDLVTVDLLLPGMDGLELTRRLHEMDPSLPLLVVTADVQEATRKEALLAGASGFVAKVEKPEVVLTTVSTLLGAPYVSSEQLDAFTELMNLSIGQAASALEALLGKRCLLRVPRVEAIPATALPNFLWRHLPFTGVAVLQLSLLTNSTECAISAICPSLGWRCCSPSPVS
ncbi:MAG: response regulator [Chloroflexia bacterium]